MVQLSLGQDILFAKRARRRSGLLPLAFCGNPGLPIISPPRQRLEGKVFFLTLLALLAKGTNFIHETAAPPKRRLEEPIFRIHGFAGQARRRSSAVLFTRPLRCRSGALREQFFEDSWLCWSSPVPDQPLGQQFYSRARCAARAGALRELFS